MVKYEDMLADNKDYTELLSVDEFCEILRVSHNVAYQILASGKVRCFKVGRIWKIPRESVNEYIIEQSRHFA